MPRRSSTSNRRKGTSWVPYRLLVAYFVACGKHLNTAHKLARDFIKPAFPADPAPTSRRKPTDEAVERAGGFELTPALVSLCRGPRPDGRRRLDHLLLAYARSGFAPEAALHEVFLDYRSMNDVPALTEAEVATYAGLCWDFLSLDDHAAGLAYLEATMPDSEELAIWHGEPPLAGVRATCTVLRGLGRSDFGGAVVVRVNDIMGQLAEQIDGDVVELGNADPNRHPDTKALKDRAMLMARLSLTQDRLRRGQETDPAMDDAVFGLDELLGEIEEGRERRASRRPGTS